MSAPKVGESIKLRDGRTVTVLAVYEDGARLRVEYVEPGIGFPRPLTQWTISHNQVALRGRERGPYQPKTGQPCHCKRGVMRDNCPDCEGTGQRIDFAAIRRRSQP